MIPDIDPSEAYESVFTMNGQAYPDLPETYRVTVPSANIPLDDCNSGFCRIYEPGSLSAFGSKDLDILTMYLNRYHDADYKIRFDKERQHARVLVVLDPREHDRLVAYLSNLDCAYTIKKYRGSR